MTRALRWLLLAVLVLFGCGAEERKVTLWHAYRGDEQIALEKVVAEWRNAHPDITVEVLAVASEAYASKLESGIPHGHGPDVFIDTHTRLGTFVQQRLVAPIALSAEERDAIDPIALSGVTRADGVYGVPLSEKTLALLVRNDLLPTTPKTLEELAHTPTPPGTYALAYEAQVAFFHSAILGAYDTSLLDADGTYGFHGDGAERSLLFVRGLVADHAIPDEASGAVVKQLFIDGKAAAVIGGPWLMSDLGDHVPYRVEPLPILAETKRPLRPLLSVEAAFVTPNGVDNPPAVDLARFLASHDSAIVFATVGKQIVSRKDAWSDPRVSADAHVRGFHEALANSVLTPSSVQMQAAWEPSDQAILKVIRGGDPHAALVDAAARFADATQPPPPPASPAFGLLAMGLVLMALAWAAVRRARAPNFRTELRASAGPYRYVAHAVVIMALLVVAPLVAGAVTSLFAGPRGEMHYVGLANYVLILTARGHGLFTRGSFYLTLLVTVVWTIANVTLHVLLGLGLGLLLSRPLLKLKAVYRVLLILPWAVPSYVTALAWKGMFHRQFGAINAILSALGCEPISWFSKFSTAFAANVATNVWLGFPFMMVVVMGALTSIPQDVLEAALVDGASRWQRFRLVTWPLLMPALLPSVVLGAVWTFNMFNVVFLVSGGEPDGETDILISEAYRWAFTRESQYGYAAAYAVLIFFMLLASSRVERKLGKAT
jgi:arabinogalactan oligomer / maltooligosaccharide transport system permease protein